MSRGKKGLHRLKREEGEREELHRFTQVSRRPHRGWSWDYNIDKLIDRQIDRLRLNVCKSISNQMSTKTLHLYFSDRNAKK